MFNSRVIIESMSLFLFLSILSGTCFAEITLKATEKNLKAAQQDNLDKNKQKPSTSKIVKVPIKETVVEIQGKTFRRIEYDKDFFYLELIDSTKANDTYRLLCQHGGHEEDLNPQVKVGAKISKHSMFILEGLKQYCNENPNGRKEVALDQTVSPGFQLNFDDETHTGENEIKFLKNKKIIVTPVEGLVFKADW